MNFGMNWIQFIKKTFGSVFQEPKLAQYELENLLDKQIEQGDVAGSRKSLKRLGRRLFSTERAVLINRCIENKKFDYAFMLATVSCQKVRRPKNY